MGLGLKEEEEQPILLKLTKMNINVNISTIRHRTHKIFNIIFESCVSLFVNNILGEVIL